MASRVYLRPAGFLYGEDGDAAIAAGVAGRLAGGAIAYAACEIIEGHAPGISRRAISYADLAASDQADLKELKERIEARRSMPFGWQSARPMIMGIVNVTPDSFSDGGIFSDADEAIAHGEELLASGANILDVGGESTRPGAEPVPLDEEMRRAMPVIEGLVAKGAAVSVDTRKAPVMRAAADAGAGMINDITALTHDPDSLEVAAQSGLPVVLMHAAGDPRTMQNDPQYNDVVAEIYDYLSDRIAACEAAGIARDRLVADPGIGFGKTAQHNLDLLREFSVFHGLGVPLLIGVSRKGFIGAVSGELDAKRRIPGSIAAALTTVAQGVQAIRVHDVAQTAQAISVWGALHGQDTSA